MEIKTFDTTRLKPGCSINLVMRGYDHKYFVVKSIVNLINSRTDVKPSTLIIHIKYKVYLQPIQIVLLLYYHIRVIIQTLQLFQEITILKLVI